MDNFIDLRNHLLYLGYFPFQNSPEWVQKLQNLLEKCGFHKLQKIVQTCSQQKFRSNIVSVFLMVFFLSSLWFLLFEAEKFIEYSEAIYFVVHSIIGNSFHTILIETLC